MQNYVARKSKSENVSKLSIIHNQYISLVDIEIEIVDVANVTGRGFGTQTPALRSCTDLQGLLVLKQPLISMFLYPNA